MPMPEQLPGEIMRLLLAVASGDQKEARRLLGDVLDLGDAALFAMIGGLIGIIASDAISVEGAKESSPGGFFGFEIVRPDGSVLEIAPDEALSPDAARVAVLGRMMAAHLNEDMSTMFALSAAEFHAGRTGFLFDLLDIAGGVILRRIRSAVEEHIYVQCAVCEEAEDVQIPYGGFTFDAGPFGKTYTSHAGWCPKRTGG